MDSSNKFSDAEQFDNANRQDEENIAAQRSAAEAIAISRATLEATLTQGEQLQHCEKLQERTKYVVDKSGRIVRGLTWSGWMMNVFSKDVEPPMDADRAAAITGKNSSQNESRSDAVSLILGENDIKNIPEELQSPARALQNYECNVVLLENCQTKQEFDTLLEICKSLHTSAQQSLTGTANLHREVTSVGGNRTRLSGRSLQLLRQLEKRLEQVENLQFSAVQKTSEMFRRSNPHSQTQQRNNSSCNKGACTAPKYTNSPSRQNIWATTTDTKMQQRIQKQDEHLDILASNIQELLHNGASIGASLQQQSELLEKLDAGTDDLTEQTKMVTRRADRLTHRSVSSSRYNTAKPNAFIHYWKLISLYS